jgi:hypothetical protein
MTDTRLENTGTMYQVTSKETNARNVEHTNQNIYLQNGQKEVWDLASEMWRLNTGKDLRPTVSQIMAGGATRCADPGTTRLYKILITPSPLCLLAVKMFSFSTFIYLLFLVF